MPFGVQSFELGVVQEGWRQETEGKGVIRSTCTDFMRKIKSDDNVMMGWKGLILYKCSQINKWLK